MRRTFDSTCNAARLARHALTANGYHWNEWRYCGELAAGKRGVGAFVRTVRADLDRYNAS